MQRKLCSLFFSFIFIFWLYCNFEVYIKVYVSCSCLMKNRKTFSQIKTKKVLFFFFLVIGENKANINFFLSSYLSAVLYEYIGMNWKMFHKNKIYLLAKVEYRKPPQMASSRILPTFSHFSSWYTQEYEDEERTKNWLTAHFCFIYLFIF